MKKKHNTKIGITIRRTIRTTRKITIIIARRTRRKAQ